MSNTTDWGSMIANIVMATTAVWAAFKANDWFKTKRLKWSTKTGHRVRVFPVSIFRFVWG
ncbi:hypothetical protein CBL31_25765 [Shigella flexneri]|nr:hypothetical protein CBL31_25765 [Shigella flexneri]